jgi:hypothetical protein
MASMDTIPLGFLQIGAGKLARRRCLPSRSGGPSMNDVTIEDFKRVTKATLRGFVRVQFSSGMIMAEISIHLGADGKPWASPPSRPMVDRDGTVMREPNTGKVRWQPLVSFTSGRLRNEWSRQIIEALLKQFPDALEPSL